MGRIVSHLRHGMAIRKGIEGKVVVVMPKESGLVDVNGVICDIPSNFYRINFEVDYSKAELENIFGREFNRDGSLPILRDRDVFIW